MCAAPNSLHVAQQLAAEIAAGALPPGARLPTHRALAKRFGIARATATRAYSQLRMLGLVVGETGRGTFVRDRAPASGWDADDEARTSGSMADLSFNQPHARTAETLLRHTLRKLATAGDLQGLLHQQPPGGRPHERRITQAFLAGQGIDADAEQVFLVQGAQHGLDVLLRAMLKLGECLAAEALTYPGLRMAAQSQGIAIAAIPTGPAGPDLDGLARACRRRAVRAIYLMPTVQNPLGSVLDAQQRQGIVAIARQYDCWLIEDATYAFLATPAPVALATLAPERTAYLTSLSKTVASGLRVGSVVVPRALAPRLKAAIRAGIWSLPSITTAVATQWMQDGSVARLAALQRDEGRQRQAIAREILAGWPLVGHPAAPFVWLPLPDDLRADRIAAALAREGIAVSQGRAYSITRQTPQALRLALSSLPLPRLREVLTTLRRTVENHPI